MQGNQAKLGNISELSLSLKNKYPVWASRVADQVAMIVENLRFVGSKIVAYKKVNYLDIKRML